VNEWTKVVTNPLGLAGFALFLIFGYLAKARKSAERRWLTPVAVFMAIGALVAGLALAYIQVARPVAPSTQAEKPLAAAQQQTNSNVQQTSTGEGSPNVQGVQGDITITVDQSNPNQQGQKPPAKKANPQGKQAASGTVQQTSTGNGSPNVQGVQGRVTVTRDPNNANQQVQQPPAQQPKQQNQ